ncbi:BREX-2 system adenine-specific DNA-methyltransferase PglX [Kitasatospora sp. A2-31]|nr:BREX-2 system adenine-specific DNA-methyltransferase PglX [Kitasatospora sp. A2-31]
MRGEPGQPEDPANGMVWRAIAAQVHAVSESDWVTVEDIARTDLGSHPWSLAGGGASRLTAALDHQGARLKARIERIGFYGDSHADEAFTLPANGRWPKLAEDLHARIGVRGDQSRDWSFSGFDLTVLPYTPQKEILGDSDLGAPFARHFWPMRSDLWMRGTFGGGTYRSDGRPWWAWHQLPKDSGAHEWAISFAFVATHNHFVLDKTGTVFNRSAPVIKLPKAVSEIEFLGLLAVLNSSAACFWLKQVCHDKGSQSGTGGFMHDEWERFYEFTGTKLQEFPLPSVMPVELGRAMEESARDLASWEPSMISVSGVPSRNILNSGRVAHMAIHRRMIALQEELDWQVYGAYGLFADVESKALTVPDLGVVPEIALGERAFEIVLARKVAAGDAETVWFERHGSVPVTEIPSSWPEWYREIVQRRINAIEKRRDIALIERPECKRRWSSPTWEKKEAEALRTWLLERCEREELWFHVRDGMRQPRTLTPAQLADLFTRDADVQAVAELYAADHLGKPDLRLSDVLREILADEHVPYLAALRYKDSGLRKREQWEKVWEQQRKEDRTGEQLDIAVPPKYSGADFRKQSYWSNRGKLDVPKERFISYPDAGPEADPKLVLGWAGWDHRDQAQAIINLVADRVERDNWQGEQLIPLLAGMLELLPWLKQWHGEFDAEWDGNPATDCQEWLESQQRDHHITTDALLSWRPSASKRGRAAAK